jgi:transposase
LSCLEVVSAIIEGIRNGFLLKHAPDFYKDCRDRSKLPNDVESLKDIIIYQQKAFSDYREKTDLLVQILMDKIERLEQEIGVLRRHRFGQKSEKSKKPSGPSSKEREDTLSPKSCSEACNRNHPGRNPLPRHLKRVPLHHDLKDEEKICPVCQGNLTRIKDLKTEQLDIIPVQLIVKEHVRARYACRKCYGTIKVADIPAQPIDKGIASSGLLAHLIVEKFDYYLPCYRLEKWFTRQGVDISRSTIVGWFYKCGILLEPLVEVMRQKGLIPSDHLFSDDTPMPTLDPGAGKTKVGRLWVYTQKETEDHGGMTVYQYTPTREGKYPKEFLEGFKGYLQADAYSGFNGLFEANEQGEVLRIEVGCWAHVRRKFVDIVKQCPGSIVQEMIDMIGELYGVERVATKADLSENKRRWLRKNNSKRILKRIYRWLKYHQPKVVPKSPLRQAIGYTLNNWRAITAFLAHGKLEIDNNRSERKIKPIVMGRKNHLFVGSEQGGKTAATFYSLIETCRQNNINPAIYLADVLEKIPTHPNKRIEELLPHNWKKSQQQRPTATAEQPTAIAA